jgi:hypothetical protein
MSGDEAGAFIKLRSVGNTPSERRLSKKWDVEDFKMCDYSLANVSSRPAVVADHLVTTSFSNSITRGFASATDLQTAVCLRPGTEIAFAKEPRFRKLFWRRTAPSKLARFRKIDSEIATTHHDALEFADGTLVLLTQLLPGQHATVLQLPTGSDNLRESNSSSEDGRVERAAL